MSKKEIFRAELLAQTVNGTITQRKVSEELGVSLRQAKRLCKRFKDEGIKGLAHKNRGKESEKK